MESKDHYKILGIERTATERDVVKAYIRLSRREWDSLSDKNPARVEEAKQTIQELTVAYRTLKDDKKRCKYDPLYRDFKNGNLPNSNGGTTGNKGSNMNPTSKRKRIGADVSLHVKPRTGEKNHPVVKRPSNPALRSVDLEMKAFCEKMFGPVRLPKSGSSVPKPFQEEFLPAKPSTTVSGRNSSRAAQNYPARRL